MASDEDPAWTAPDGSVWVCTACGKYGPKRHRIGDESCFVNAELILLDKLVFTNGRVTKIKE